QWQVENVASATDWGFDSDNAVYIDNIKVERVYEGLSPLAFTMEGGDILVLNWTAPATGTTKLQAASNVAGPYTDVATDAGSTTYRASTTGGQKFFRLVWEAPVQQ